jgi:DNA-binding response OmpR family regulator
VSRKTDDSEVSLKKGAHCRSRVVLSGIRRQYVAMRTVAPGPELGLRALVVDDEIPLADVVAGYLKREMFEVHLAHDGHRALDLAREVDPHVVVLDIGLPGVDGVEVCRQLRVFSDAYVVMLTARDTEMDTIVGLSVGADDYVTKPFSPRELVARVRAMMRRPRRPSTGQAESGAGISPPREFGELLINVDGREVYVEGTSVSLTRTEFDILEALSARPGVVLSRHQLLASVWGEPWVGADNIVDVHVGHLRRKLGDSPTTPRYVTTVRGVGYRMGAG